MANRLVDLFGDKTIAGRDQISTPGMSLNDIAMSGSASPSGAMLQVEMMNRVIPKVDYSDFSNFVFFNSALDYFNISGDRIINEYPYDGTFDDQMRFTSASDPYQMYLNSVWPRWSGSFNFSEAGGYPIVTTSDAGTRTSGSTVLNNPALSIGTGSFTAEMRLYFPQTIPADVYYPVMQRCRNDEFANMQTNYFVPNIDDPTWEVFAFNSASENYLALHVSGTFPSGSSSLDPMFKYVLPLDLEDVGIFAAWVVDQDAKQVNLYLTQPASGSVANFSEQPFLAHRWDAIFPEGGFDTDTSYFVVGAGAMGPMTGYTPGQNFHLGELRYWKMARDQHDIFTTYNTKVYKDAPLILNWRFAEPYKVYDNVGNASLIVRDYSGNKLDGMVKTSTPGFVPTTASFIAASDYGFAGFGMSPQEPGELILSPQSSLVFNFVSGTQVTASLFDRNNPSIITNLMPKQFFSAEDTQNTSVLKNLVYLLGRQFDEIKVYIDQMPKLFIADQRGYNTTPDALLGDALDYWGWKNAGNFLNKDAFQWLFGVNVLDRTQDDIAQQRWANEKLDIQLFDIKNEFWRRTLNNLPYLYKKKGTREAVDALLRIYGLDNSVVRLKEFGYQPNVHITTQRISGLKSAPAFKMSQISGTFTIRSGEIDPPVDPGGEGEWTAWNGVHTFEAQVMFPPIGSRIFDFSTYEGSIYKIQSRGSGYEQLTYTRHPPGFYPLNLGTLTYYVDFGEGGNTATFEDVPIFDGRWYHMTVKRWQDIYSNWQLSINFEHLDNDVVDTSLTYTSGDVGTRLDNGSPQYVEIGAGDFWTNNVQMWRGVLSGSESRDHTLNPFSAGTEYPDGQANQLLWWKLDELIDSDNGVYYDSKYPSGTNVLNPGTFTPDGYYGSNLDTWAGGPDFYGRFNFVYNFIAPPDFSWTEEKVRYIDKSKILPGDQWSEVNDAAIEFNLIDALNEDISTIISSMDNWNNIIGMPVAKYNDDYQDLMKLRQQYFSRLSGRINFRAFADFMDFFDRSFLDLVKRLLPARVDFKGAELVVESHMLERPKVQYSFRPPSLIMVPEGVVSIYSPYVPMSSEYLANLPTIRAIAPPQTATLAWSGNPTPGSSGMHFLRVGTSGSAIVDTSFLANLNNVSYSTPVVPFIIGSAIFKFRMTMPSLPIGDPVFGNWSLRFYGPNGEFMPGPSMILESFSATVNGQEMVFEMTEWARSVLISPLGYRLVIEGAPFANSANIDATIEFVEAAQ